MYRLLCIITLFLLALLLISCEDSATDPETRQEPYQATAPHPADGAALTAALDYLSWNCTDPNGDDLTYAVYFGTEENPPMVAENLTDNVYYPDGVEDLTDYYWYVVATDASGNSSTSPVWQFTTTAIPEIANFSLTTHFINNLPLIPAVYHELTATVTLNYAGDPLHIDNVLLMADEAGIAYEMTPQSAGAEMVYSVTALADTMPGNSINDFVDTEFYCKVTDVAGNEVLSNTKLISRIFETYPTPDFPVGGLPYPNDTLKVFWYPYDQLFDFTYEVQLFAGNSSEYFWNETGISQYDLSLVLFAVDEITFGTYYWRIKAVDQFGNSALSTKAHFTIMQ